MSSRFVCSLGVFLVCGPALADPPSKPALSEQDALNFATLLSQVGGAMSMKDDDAADLPKFEEITKGMKSSPGLLTLWHYPPDAKEKDQEKLLCQIPSGFLGEKFMLSTSISGGGFMTGFPLDERVVQWEMLDRQVLLVAPETQYVAEKDQPVSDVVRRTYPDRIRASIPLLTKSPGGDPVIDLGALLKSDFADISWMNFGPLGQIMGGGGVNASLSKWTKKKAFELNVEIGVELAVPSYSPPGSFDKKMVHFSFWKLPSGDYTPRIADDRIGYFLTTNQDWARPTGARDIFNRYIDRWHLVKRDPSLAMCEPKQPIIYYIEKTVPIRFRRAVREGILEWNKAYEKVGFVNAVEVRQQTDDNEWKDLDPEDMRYSFFRWIVTGAGFAMGPHRANPFTGQIYDADIIFDDSMVRYYEQDAQQMLPSTTVGMKFNDWALREFVAKFPQWRRPTRSWEAFSFGRQDDERLREALRQRMQARGQHCCEYADGMKQQMAFSHAVLAEQPTEVVERFLHDAIKEVVMHEVGHTLGLRHNFKASSIWSVEQIRERRARGEATTGSVMDYNPVLFFADKPLDGNFITPTIGPYDYWAIEYGYRPLGGSEPPTPTSAAEDDEDEAKPAANENMAAAEPKPKLPHNDGMTIQISGSPEMREKVLASLPPEVRAAVMEKMSAAEAGGKPGPRKPRTSAPSFTGPNAAEEEMLRRIASRAAEPELAYATDEDTTGLGPDPRSNRFDMASDPIEWAEARMAVVDQRLKTIMDWAVKDAESWYFLRQAFGRLMFEKVGVLDFVGRYIGGQNTSRSHRGDAKAAPPFEVVDAKTQRRALDFIAKTLYSDECFAVDPKVLNHLAAARWWHEGTSISFTVDYPYYEMVGVMQWWNLFDRLFPNTLRRIHDAELKTTESDKFTAAEYLQRLQAACWESSVDAGRAGDGTWADDRPYISGIRRSLQREYLNVVEPLVRTPPGAVLTPDLHAMVQHTVRRLSKQIDGVLASDKLDFASQAHLTACKSRIERMLAPELREQGGGGYEMSGY